MRKLAVVLFCILLMGTISGCSSDYEWVMNAEELEESPTTGSNVLIAYFSVPEAVDTTDAIAGASIVVKDGEKLGNTENIATPKLIQWKTAEMRGNKPFPGFCGFIFLLLSLFPVAGTVPFSDFAPLFNDSSNR